MNGYLSYSRVKGDTRLAKHKMEEIADRVSMQHALACVAPVSARNERDEAGRETLRHRRCD